MNTGHRCREISVQRWFILSQPLEILQNRAKSKGCENPGALSSLTFAEEGAAMKLTETKALSTPGGKQKRL